jgi:L,D-transpeptidase YcbB
MDGQLFWPVGNALTSADKTSMGRKYGLIVTLMLLVSNPAFGDVETTEGMLLSSVILSEPPPFLPLSEEIQEQPALVSRQSFGSLADAVLLYESIQNSERWKAFTAGPLLRHGDRHKQVSQLKGQLQLLGDLPKQAVFSLASQYFDDELQAALVRFQARHSVKADGILGPQTRVLLNVPPWQRIDQLVLNMQRQRQLENSGDVYLHVNIPEYRLRLYQRGEVLLDMRTVVGKRKRQTPVFSATVNRLVINPGWNVPKSIAYKDILPKLKDDPEFLEKSNLRVLSGWSTPRVEVSHQEIDYNQMYQGKDYYRFWEPPGKGNTLGRMKFQLSSDNSIYLHDTQQKYLFDAEKRAFSSGCIRLEDPRGLADALIQVSNQWSPELLDPLFENEDTIKLRLAKPVPVHVTYWTAWLDKSGVLNFANDLYQRDGVDFAAMQNQHQQVGMSVDWLKTVQNGGP